MQSTNNVLTTDSPQTNSITPLPISPKDAERITTLTKQFKSRGHFDALRKDIFSSFYDSISKQNLINSLNALAAKEVERDPGLLQRDRAKAALLLDGVVEREKEVYKGVEREVEDMVGWQKARVEELVNRILSEVEGVELKHTPEEEGERAELEEEGRRDILDATKASDENVVNGGGNAAVDEIQVQRENEVQVQLEPRPEEAIPQELVPEQEDRMQRDLDRDRDITNLIQTHSNARSSTQLNSRPNSNTPTPLTPIPSAPFAPSTITSSVPIADNIDKDAIPSTFARSSETPQREREVNGATPTPLQPLDPHNLLHNHSHTNNRHHSREREPRERDRDREFRDRDWDKDRDRDRDLPLSSFRDRDRDYRESRDRDRVRNRDRDYPTRSPRSRLYRGRSRDHLDRSYRPRSGSRDRDYTYRPRSRSRGRSRDFTYRPRDCSRSRDRSRTHRNHQDRSRERDRSRYRDRDRDRDRDQDRDRERGKRDSSSSR